MTVNKPMKQAVPIVVLALCGCDGTVIQSDTSDAGAADAGHLVDAGCSFDAGEAPCADSIANLPLHARTQHSALLLRNGKVLLVAGVGMQGLLAEAELYDPSTGKFGPAGMLHVPRRLHVATVLSDGNVLITGGFDGNANVADTELFDTATGNFMKVGAMRDARTEHAAALLSDGRVLVAGGWRDGMYLSSAEIYDPATQQFTEVGSLHTPRSALGMTLLADGRVLITGGDNFGSVETAELFDPATNQFQVVAGVMIAPRYRHETIRVASGEVLAIGGFGGVDILESYVPSAQSFIQQGSMFDWRSFHRAVLLTDDRIAILGGWNPGGELATSECFNPISQLSSVGVAMTTPRRMHSATLVCGDRILVVGGEHSSVPLQSAELIPAASICSAGF